MSSIWVAWGSDACYRSAKVIHINGVYTVLYAGKSFYVIRMVKYGAYLWLGSTLHMHAHDYMNIETRWVLSANYSWLGLARTIYSRCIYNTLGREITKYAVITRAYIQLWPTLHISDNWYSWMTAECFQQSTHEEHLVPSQKEHDLGHGQEQTLSAISKVLMKNTWYRHKKSMI